MWLNKDQIKRDTPLSRVLRYYGARHVGGALWHCIPAIHGSEDIRASLMASDERGIATCNGPSCRLPRGSDIFAVIQAVDGIGFQDALRRAQEIGGLPMQKEQTVAETGRKDLSTDRRAELERIPKTWRLEKKHIKWLHNRYGVGWSFLVEKFQITGWHRHIAMPISQESAVFIPLDKEKDQMFYRGKVRTTQVFPNWPEAHSKAESILVVEGEKDVLKATLQAKKLGILGEWAVITNTNGAQSIKSETQLFKNFVPEKIHQVTVAYDNDPAGERGNRVAMENARRYFGPRPVIGQLRFHERPRGWDISDHINEGLTFLEQVVSKEMRQKLRGGSQEMEMSL